MFAGRVIAGGLLLVLGRRLFWVYIAILGFATGLNVSSQLFNVQPEWVQFVIAIAFGILGALLAYFFQEIAVAVGGFLAGSYVAMSLFTTFGYQPASNGDVLVWGLFIVGGLVGAVLAIMLFEWALIILTSVAGALLMTEGLGLTMPWSGLAVVCLAIIGMIIQITMEGRPIARQREDVTTPRTM